MNAITTLCVPVLLVVCLWASGATAIKCYNCPSGCSDSYKDNTCEGEVCMMSRGKASGTEITSRECVPKAGQEMKCTTAEVAGVETSICYCDSELCNGAATMWGTGASIVLATLILAKNLM